MEAKKIFGKLSAQSELIFDYELNDVKFENKNRSDSLLFISESIGYSKNYGKKT
jgi:regulator of sigma D